ncbi:hypothetical protein BT96DRAFT_835151, partial [Gymnopus androsaceus JB14]
YFTNKREVYGQLVQYWTRHAFVGKYYTKFAPTRNIQCPCGNRFQSREHILTSCKRYTNYHDILWEVSENRKLDEIVGRTYHRDRVYTVTRVP